MRAVLRIAALAQGAEGQHVRVRPVTGSRVDAPFFRPLEHRLQQAPFVPEVVRDAPHVGIRLQVLRFGKRGGAGAEAEHDVPAAGAAGFGDQLDFPAAVGIFPGDVVALDEVHAPFRVEAENAVVIGGRFGQVAPETVHIGIPGADGVGVGRVLAEVRAVRDGQVPVRRHAGHSAHDVDAELQPQAVDIVRQRFEARAVRGAGEAVDRGGQPAVFIHGQLGKRLVAVVDGGGLVPLDVHHDVFPAEGFQLLRHVLRVAADDALRDGCTVAVPAVPAHGRCLRDHETPPFFPKRQYYTRETA